MLPLEADKDGTHVARWKNQGKCEVGSLERPIVVSVAIARVIDAQAADMCRSRVCSHSIARFNLHMPSSCSC